MDKVKIALIGAGQGKDVYGEYVLEHPQHVKFSSS